MKRPLIQIEKGFGQVWLCTWILALLLSWACVRFLGRPLIDRLTHDDAEYLSSYYNYVNTDTGGWEREDNPVTLIDISRNRMDSREGIAAVLRKVIELEPLAIGLDVICPADQEHTQAENQALREAVEACGDKLVVAARIHADTLQHSFFTLGSGVRYGTVNGQNIFRFNWQDRVNDTLTVDRLVVAMARTAGYPIDTLALESCQVNYRTCHFLKASSLEDIISSRIRDRVVLIGDFDNQADQVDLPFRIGGEFLLPGILLNAYHLMAVLQPDKMFRPLAKGWTLFLNAFLLLLFSGIFVLLSDKENRDLDAPGNMPGYVAFLLLKIVLIFLCATGAILACCLLIKHQSVVTDAAVFVVAEVLLLDFCYKFVKGFYNHRHPKS